MSSTQTTLPKVQSEAARSVFFKLFEGPANPCVLEDAADFLTGQLEIAAQLDCDLPDSIADLTNWMESSVEKVGHQYLEYLEARKAGGPRHYFGSTSHALHFIKSVAPTKLVDGAWLYGLLPRWQDTRFLSLIQTYLEELGEGQPNQNHVVLYRKLLATQGLERWDDLSDDHYIQGAIQLALAYNAEQFLPEVIGFNLGYEQLPLHLLITAYELKELGIDPYYFTLHVTVDNSDSGHARKAVDAISDAMPRLGDPKEFYRRVQNGYMLNSLGASTNSVIASFDLKQELVTILQRKGAIGQYAHSDYRQVENRTVNDWLSCPAQTTDFVSAMEQSGWFKRHQDPHNSRFWKLIESENAKMFGVFNPYERQVIYDWIAGDALPTLSTKKNKTLSLPLYLQEKAQRAQTVTAIDQKLQQLVGDTSNTTASIAQHQELRDISQNNDFDDDVRTLKRHLATTNSQNEAVNMLIRLMSPAYHHSQAGLMATRIFNDMVS